jgi:SAM-dependent methyltransferase
VNSTTIDSSRPPSGAGSTAVLDSVGEETLELFQRNEAYSELLWNSLRQMTSRAVEGRLLEIGCGIGNVTRLVLRDPGVELLHGIDLDPAYVARVRDNIDDPRLRVTAASAEEFCPLEYSAAGKGFDVIFSSNVLEHIENDTRVLQNFRAMLRPDGVVLTLVPAHSFLFCGLDRNLSHFRRYNAALLREKAAAAGLRVVSARYFNPLGALGWWWNGKVLRRGVLPEGQLAFYSRFGITLSRWIDQLNPFPVGVSLLAALELDRGNDFQRTPTSHGDP